MSAETALAGFISVVLATGAMRLVELAVSARRLRRNPERLVAEPRVFPLMVLLHAGLIAGPIVEVVALDRTFRPILAAGAGAVFALATGLRIWTLSTIGGAWNVRVVRPDAGTIVTTGPYARIRHPNYLAVTLEIASLPLLHTAWLSAVLLSALNAFVLYHRIRVEEEQLMQLPAWRAAMSSRARFFPGVF